MNVTTSCELQSSNLAVLVTRVSVKVCRKDSLSFVFPAQKFFCKDLTSRSTDVNLLSDAQVLFTVFLSTTTLK